MNQLNEWKCVRKVFRPLSLFSPLALLVPTLCVGTQVLDDASSRADESKAPPAQPAARARFAEVARQRGVEFEHFDPVTDRQYISETIGSGAGWIDFDADGHLDLVLLNSAPMPGGKKPDRSPLNAIFRNRGDGSFDDACDRAWQSGPGFGQGCAVGDFDNDGFDDLFLSYYLDPNRLYLNNGDGTLSEIGQRAATTGIAEDKPATDKWSSSSAFGDLDGDGDVDLYVCNYVSMPLGDDYPFCGDKRRNIRTVCSPAKFPGQPDDVVENVGDGTFRDASEAWGFGQRAGDRGQESDGRGLGVVIADLDEDGLPDVYVANDLSPNLLYRNLGGGRFREEGLLAGCALSADGKAQAGMGVDVGDVDGDGRPDIFVTNYFREPNSLFHNSGRGQFREISARSGLGRPSFLKLGFGCGFFDADNDGHLDVFVANGHIDRNPEAHGTPEPYRQPAQLFLGNGQARFQGITDASAGSYLQEPHVGRAAAFADFDNDGRMDLAVNHNGEPAALLRNESPGGHWLRIMLVGSASNRGGVGTRVTAAAGDRRHMYQLAGGRSYLSAHDPRLLIGLGTEKVVERLEIRWPNGKIKMLTDLPADQTIVVRE